VLCVGSANFSWRRRSHTTPWRRCGGWRWRTRHVIERWRGCW